ncbi:MAG: hypothetical protein HYZ50_02110 [Deltaproteobacteria bacterium]|nr:hypothetical protein [Deltaproteobacteria bacterium]
MAWQWHALDGGITKAPVGGAATGPSPGERPARGGTRRHPLCLEAGYDYAEVVEGGLERDSMLPLRPPGQKHRARRGVVERTHAWHNKFRRLLGRGARKLALSSALLALASMLIIWRILSTASPSSFRTDS